MNKSSVFNRGFKAMLPIITGVIPFGAVVGTVTADAKISFSKSLWMNILLYAGAAELAAVELMTRNATSFIVVVTGLIINLRFLLYSAALSPVVQRSSSFKKFVCAMLLTDQTYAVMSANQHKLNSNSEAIEFYLGACLCMVLSWHLSVAGGYVFGNFAPASWALDYAVPLSFIALVMPSLKNKKYVGVACFSSICSLLLSSLPYRIGLVLTAVLAIGFAVFITSKPKGAK